MSNAEALKLIQPGSIIQVKTVAKLKFSNVFQKLILWWGKNIEKEEYVANHSAIYMGSGKHEIIEANGGKVRIRKVDQFFRPYNQVYFFHNANLTVDNLQKGKEAAYSRVFERKGLDIKGRLYDWAEFLRFINPKIKDNPNADICSRLAWDITKIMGLPIVDEDKHNRISPARLQDYLIDSAVNNSDGWICSTVWNRDRFQPLSEII